MSYNFNDYDSSGPRPPIPGEETTTNRKVFLILNNLKHNYADNLRDILLFFF